MRLRELRVSLKLCAQRLWSGADGIAKLVRNRLDIMMLRLLLDPTARPLLSGRYGADSSAVLDRIWERARKRSSTLSRQSTVGGAIMVRLAAVTAAAYDTFIVEGATAEEATRAVYDIAWAVYQKMGRAAWAFSAVAGRKNADRLRIATVAFRTFPFSAPSYAWKDVLNSAGVIAFDCLKCPVAEYFETQHLSELCVQTWCALDFPLAETIWHGKLERSGSIAGGQSHCDFRWSSDSDRSAAPHLG